ncbi:MAG: DNA polymerase III subunit alpha [Candidatus Paceibacterota bacterium]
MSDFTHLHVHSHYSLLDGLPKIDELVDYADQQGMDAVALTDHGVLYGAVEFYKKAKERGIKPIIGCELYEAYERMGQKRPNIDNKSYHLLTLVKNQKGYENLVKLVTEAHLKGFYYKPRVDEYLLEDHGEGLIASSACVQGKIPQLLLQGEKEEAKRTAEKYKDIFDEFYLELQHHPDNEDQQEVNEKILDLSEELDMPLLATNDVHYLKEDDDKAQDILMLINTNADKDDPERLTMQRDDYSLRSEETMKKQFEDHPEAIENTQKIKEKCNFEFDLDTTRLPEFEVPNGKSKDEYLRELCMKGIEERYGEKTDEIMDRLERELSVITNMNFSSYFLIVQDFVNWAKEHHIVVGPGRGSAGGSLVSYLLHITDIDPLKYDLLFERFLNPGRAKVSFPDIDLDFTDRRRDEVIEYVANKYGKDKVAQIITFGTMAARGVIRDVGRVLDYSYDYCDKVAKMIPMQMSLDEALEEVKEFKQLYEQDEKAEKLIDLGKKLEGVARHASTHACGVVISDVPLEKIIPVQHSSQSDKDIVTQYEMHSVEDIGLLKMDFLGLKNLTIIEDTLSRIYEVHGENIDIENLPLDDEKTFELFQSANTTGIFQLESGGMKRYLEQLKPTEFEDIIAMVSLYRPGPMENIPKYIARKHGEEEVEYLHPRLKPILKSTYGIIVYQEQVMKIAQELAGFSLEEADILRKAIGKKIRSLLEDQKEKFINGMKENDIEEGVAKEIWDWIEPFAEYSFNKSHATAYAMIAYRTAYLKAHYPVEFMSALLTSKKNDVDEIAGLIEECREMDIEVLPPDINESFRNFSVVAEEDKIRFGLLAIKNVGESVVEDIVEERKSNGTFESMEDFLSRVDSKGLNKTSLECLIKVGAFDRFDERNKLLSNLQELLEFSKEINERNNSDQQNLFQDEFDAKLTLKEANSASQNQKLQWEGELLGLFVSGDPLDEFKDVLEDDAFPIEKIKEDLKSESDDKPRNPFSRKIASGKKLKVGGMINNVNQIRTKNGNPMLFAELRGVTDKIEVVVFPSTFEEEADKFKKNNVVILKGKVDEQDGEPKIICQEVEKVINQDQ